MLDLCPPHKIERLAESGVMPRATPELLHQVLADLRRRQAG